MREARDPPVFTLCVCAQGDTWDKPPDFRLGTPQEMPAGLLHMGGVPVLGTPWYLCGCFHSPVVGGQAVTAPAGDKVGCGPTLAGQPPIYNR